MRKNETRLSYKEEPFIVWQDNKLSWFFTYRNLENVNTGHHELQSALNVIYESIDDKTRSSHRKPSSFENGKAVNKPVKSTSIFDRI